MMIIKFCLLGLFSTCFLLNVVRADDCTGGSFRNLGLCQEFLVIRNLAPKASVIALIQNHMQTDIRFRKAVQYMLSPDFDKTTAKIDATSVYQSFLRQFTNAGVNTTDIDSVSKIFDCVLIPILVEATGNFRSSPNSVVVSRSLETFVQQVGALIPQKELVNTLDMQIAENKEFAKFYRVIRNPTFQSNVMKGFINRDISRPIKTLRRYQIDLSKLTQYVFNLFSLGPAV
ncbi:hypothetical protein FF38_02102 [Lucilia cuprina]|uniref:Protein G12 n=1 Tax=Lucilia cuprina TaxID=7375 RepID=A0A0L0CRX3_LUCCU|nr:hypothetical protein CVS40_10930 [Lucilia cuprina]KNC34942.1 hypothetical protein FF38_02102 [Lucilia cuprina]